MDNIPSLKERLADLEVCGYEILFWARFVSDERCWRVEGKHGQWTKIERLPAQ
jgi:hypothetical protein